jgi:hypothetical protein
MNKKDVKVTKEHQVQIVLLAHVMYRQVLKFKHEHKLLHMWLFQWVEVVLECVKNSFKVQLLLAVTYIIVMLNDFSS